MSDGLVAKDLAAGYASTPEINGVDLEVGPGSPPTGIIGRSGIGKTTLLQALVGEIPVRNGLVTWAGHDISKFRFGTKKRYQAAVRLVRQGLSGGADPQAKVSSVVANAIRNGRRAGRASGDTAESLLDSVLLPTHLLGRVVQTLSGGERQRLALALAFATKPDVLLLDEPFTALDPQLREEVLQRVKQEVADRNIGLLVATHDVKTLMQLCTHIQVLDEGTFVQSGPIRQVLDWPKHPITREFADSLKESYGLGAHLGD